MEKCAICPRECGVDREKTRGFCGVTNKIRVNYVMLHHYEEPIISGENLCDKGSGAIFFAGCNLRCEYCQNYQLSHGAVGQEITIFDLAKIFKGLEEMGAYNINLVTPTHFTLQIIEALKIYKPKIPVVWNTSGYEKPETIELLRGLVDIFLTDFKYMGKDAGKLSNAENYSYYATHSIPVMRDIVGSDLIENGLMKKGLIVRHLVLPNFTNDSKEVLDWIQQNLGTDTIVSIMNQYVPMYNACKNPLINRKLKPIEYKRVVNYALSLSLENAYIQDSESADTFFTPNFGDDKNLLNKLLELKL